MTKLESLLRYLTRRTNMPTQIAPALSRVAIEQLATDIRTKFNCSGCYFETLWSIVFWFLKKIKKEKVIGQ